RASEAIRELEVIKDKPRCPAVCTMALIHAHKKAKLVDREAVQELETSSDRIDSRAAKYLETKNNFSGALELINQAVVGYPDFIPALIEKMRLQLALQDWDQTLETAQRALNSNRNCIEAQRMIVMYTLCRDGKYSEHGIQIGERTLKYRLQSYGLRRRCPVYDLAQVRQRVAEELDGPGCMGGYRSVWHTLRLEGLQVPREVVANSCEGTRPRGL
ncbi:Tetratricopeptide repeat protein 21B, partial [Desmophyllum pertusum]